MTTKDVIECNGCNNGYEPGEVCPDGYCRACHKSLSFDDCVSGEWVKQQRLAAGPPIYEA